MLICGVDEAGRGALAGSVVAAAVMYGGPPTEGLRDSKKLSPAARERLADKIREESLCYAVGESSVEEIERYNILQATGFAMQRAVSGIVICPDEVWVDGDFVPEMPYPAKAIIGGDDEIAAIMAASILAKTHRDALMRRLDEEYPNYGFAKHKGYGTKEHLDSLRRLGATVAHRKTFAPVAAVCL